ncbi:MAG: hypothetical protein ACRDHL_08665, partial [Candidatus Promineifilaceae bacterium]
YMELPSEAFGWQTFAGVYDASLTVNYPTGAPGSYFTFTGQNYPPNTTADISVNGEFLGTVEVDADGAFTFVIYTVGAQPGTYSVTAAVDANATATAVFELLVGEPIRPLEGDEPIFFLVERQLMPAILYN